MFRYFIYVPGMQVDADVMANRSLGGSESSGAYLARELVRRGNQVSIFSNVPNPSWWEGVQVLPIGEMKPEAPLGMEFERIAVTVPHDVLIVQRHPSPFPRVFNSKLNLWWTHDLARARMTGNFKNTGWNCQGVLAVSDWHKAQVQKVHGLQDGYVHALRNGIDLDLFKDTPNYDRKFRGKKLIYSSRPERGLINLVNEGGIMERLAKIDPEITLIVAFYDNAAPQLQGLYNYIFSRCQQLPNVEVVGPQPKNALAQLMYDSALLVYPTVPAREHEETSCISVMEAQAAGTPVIACANGAIPETMNDPHAERSILIPYLSDGATDIDRFTMAIVGMLGNQANWQRYAEACRDYVPAYSYEKPAAWMDEFAEHTLRERSSNPMRLASHLLYQADYEAARALFAKGEVQPTAEQSKLMGLYGYLDAPEKYAQHYERSAELFLKYSGIKERGGMQGANLQAAFNGGHFREILPLIDAELKRGPARILDYGCGVGALSLALAERYPDDQIVGVDISQQNVDTLNHEAEVRGFKNVKAIRADSPMEIERPIDGTGISRTHQFDIAICAETMEHLCEEPYVFSETLEELCKPGGLMVVTFPSTAPDEYIRAEGEEERVEHVRFIDHHDADEMWGKKPGYAVRYHLIKTETRTRDPLGGAIVTWRADHKPNGIPDLARKLASQAPHETLGVLMICRWDEPTIERTLQSVAGIANEIVVGVDHGPTEAVIASLRWDALKHKYPSLTAFSLTQHPLVDGFDLARNEVLDKITSDWVLWIDADETLVHGERILKYLRPNAFQGYAISQQHHAADVPGGSGVLKVDLPCRLFRRDTGFRFWGVVHEHPSLSTTKEPDQCYLIGEGVCIFHPGYMTEEVRRKRFERNIPLMKKDREKYPERTLGKYLWARDLIHMARYEREKNGNQMTPQIAAWANEALTLFREMVATKNVRLVTETLPYASEATLMLYGDNAYQSEMGINVSRGGLGDFKGQPIEPMRVALPTVEDVLAVSAMLAAEKTGHLNTPYF